MSGERHVRVAQHVVSAGGASLRVQTEESAEESYAAYTWPSARVLAAWVLSERAWLPGKTVIELGAGTALPGLVAVLCGAHVTLTDQDEGELRAARAGALLNSVSCACVPLAWGDWAALASLPSADLVLGSDVLYDSALFDLLLATVSELLRRARPGARFVTSYQHRSLHASLPSRLERFSLRCAAVIPAAEVLPEGAEQPGETIEVVVLKLE